MQQALYVSIKPFMKPKKKLRFSKILIIRLDRIGDFTLSIPLIEQIAARYPHAQIDLMVKQSVLPLAKRCPIHRAIVHDQIKEDMVGFLREQGYDCVLCLYPNNLLFYLQLTRAGIRQRIGFDLKGSGVFLTHPIRYRYFPYYRKKIHVLNTFKDVLNMLECHECEYHPQISLSEGDILSARKVMDGAKDYIVMAPFADSNPKKEWPLKRFVLLADALSEKTNKTIAFIGTEDDRKRMHHALKESSKHHMNLCGKTDLTTLAAIIQNAELIVCVDSGPMHIAAAVNTPIVALFGSSDPEVWGPIAENATIIQAEGMDCIPCAYPLTLKTQLCKSPECMNRIQINNVLEAIKRILENNH